MLLPGSYHVDLPPARPLHTLVLILGQLSGSNVERKYECTERRENLGTRLLYINFNTAAASCTAFGTATMTFSINIASMRRDQYTIAIG